MFSDESSTCLFNVCIASHGTFSGILFEPLSDTCWTKMIFTWLTENWFPQDFMTYWTDNIIEINSSWTLHTVRRKSLHRCGCHLKNRQSNESIWLLTISIKKDYLIRENKIYNFLRVSYRTCDFFWLLDEKKASYSSVISMCQLWNAGRKIFLSSSLLQLTTTKHNVGKLVSHKTVL